MPPIRSILGDRVGHARRATEREEDIGPKDVGSDDAVLDNQNTVGLLPNPQPVTGEQTCFMHVSGIGTSLFES